LQVLDCNSAPVFPLPGPSPTGDPPVTSSPSDSVNFADPYGRLSFSLVVLRRIFIPSSHMAFGEVARLSTWPAGTVPGHGFSQKLVPSLLRFLEYPDVNYSLYWTIMLRFSCYKSWPQGAGIEPPYWRDARPCSRILNGLGDDAIKPADIELLCYRALVVCNKSASPLPPFHIIIRCCKACFGG
jgi:hypothetical protein